MNNKKAGRAAQAGELIGSLQGKIELLVQMLQQKDAQIMSLTEGLGQLVAPARSICQRMDEIAEKGKAPTLDAPLSAYLTQLAGITKEFTAGKKPVSEMTDPVGGDPEVTDGEDDSGDVGGDAGGGAPEEGAQEPAS